MVAFGSRPIPLASFGSVMGIEGLGLAWRVAAHAGGAPAFIGESLLACGAALFVILAGLWLRGSLSHPQELRVETHVAITASYLGAIVISTSLLAAAAVPYSRPTAYVLWGLAAAGGAGLLIALLGRWIEFGVKDFELTPAIFIPAVGNATTVYAAVALGQKEIAWVSFSFALLCWLTLGPIVTYRLLVNEPRLPKKMAPQLAVLVSSPAVLASAWYALVGPDAVFKILAFKALFFALLTLRLWRIGWGERYNVAMWGWTFPAAALAGAFERAASSLSDPLYHVLASVSLVFATLTVTACASATLRGWIRAMRVALPAA
jgi:tellurite resistance protein